LVGVSKTTSDCVHHGANVGDALSFERLEAKFCNKDRVTTGSLEII